MINLSFSQSSIIQRSLFSANNSLATAMQRLSTGCRINGAADDAAGLSLSTKLASSIRGFNIANQNTQTGISFLNTADGALSTMTKDVQRIRDLAVQAANGVYSNNERAMLNNEAQQRLEGIKQTINSTSFGDKKIFSDGTTPSTQMTEAAAIAAGYTVIKTAAEFVANIPQNGAATAGKTYMLMGDIDMSSIANYTAKTNFSGTFDGNGYKISNLTINKPGVDDQGLFGRNAANTSQFKNLTLNNFNITGNNYTAALMGSCWGTTTNIDNVKITNSTIQGFNNVGGLIGFTNTAVISNCTANCNISGSGINTGGLIGWMNFGGSISKSSSSGSVSGIGSIGGIIGKHEGYGTATITECSSSASVSCSTAGNNSTGGLIGIAGNDNLDLTVQNCYTTGDVVNGSGFIGGTFEGTYQ
ncbi:MAG: flagellin [bacterium]